MKSTEGSKQKILKKRVRLGLAARSALFFSIFCATPFTVSAASLEITELMYDPPGANAGRQWLEVTNFASTSVSLAGWRVSEGGTNHKLVAARGTTTLNAGASLIVSSDPQQFSADYPQYAGALLKSALSLTSKSGESVILKNASLEPVDTVTYAPSAGAQGDDNTLHRVGGTLVAGAPDPGRYSTTPPAPLAPKAAASGTSAQSLPAAKSPAKATPLSTAPPAAPAAQAAALGAALPAHTNPLVTWGAGTVGAVLMLVAAWLWLFPHGLRRERATAASADEFEIEE